MQQIKVGQYVQIATKTSRHQLHGKWLLVTSAKPGSTTITALDGDNKWRLSRNVVLKVRDKGDITSTVPAEMPKPGLTEVPMPASFAPKANGAKGDQDLIDTIAKLTEQVGELSTRVNRMQVAMVQMSEVLSKMVIDYRQIRMQLKPTPDMPLPSAN